VAGHSPQAFSAPSLGESQLCVLSLLARSLRSWVPQLRRVLPACGCTALQTAVQSRAVTFQKPSPSQTKASTFYFHAGVLWCLLFLIVAAASCTPSSSSAASGVCGCNLHLFSWLMLSFTPPDQQGSHVYLRVPGHCGSAHGPLLYHQTQLWSLLHLPRWHATCPADPHHHKQGRQRCEVGLLHMLLRHLLSTCLLRALLTPVGEILRMQGEEPGELQVAPTLSSEHSQPGDASAPLRCAFCQFELLVRQHRAPGGGLPRPRPSPRRDSGGAHHLLSPRGCILP